MPDYSYWIIFGLLLIIAEFMVTGLVIIFLGLAAVLVGILKYVGLIDSLPLEVTLFAVLSIGLLLALRRTFSEKLMGKEVKDGNAPDPAGLIGQRATVIEPFKNGVGLVSYRGAKWQAESAHPLEKDQIVRITSNQGLWLTVEPWQSS